MTDEFEKLPEISQEDYISGTKKVIQLCEEWVKCALDSEEFKEAMKETMRTMCLQPEGISNKPDDFDWDSVQELIDRWEYLNQRFSNANHLRICTLQAIENLGESSKRDFALFRSRSLWAEFEKWTEEETTADFARIVIDMS